MITIIWKEMYYAKKNEEYITLYISFLKSIKKYIDLIIIIFTSTGVLSWFSENKESKIIMGVCLVIVGIFQSIEIIQTKFIASDEYIDDAIDLKLQWIAYFNKLEKLLLDTKINKTDNSTILSSYNRLKSLKQSIEKKDSDIKLWRIHIINKKADLRTNNFMYRYYENR